MIRSDGYRNGLPAWSPTIKGSGRSIRPALDPQPEAVAPGPLQPGETYVSHRDDLPIRRLTKSERRKLMASRMGVEAQRQAVIIGGGPGGLAAAITLAEMGMKVTVLEARANETGDKPAHARPHQISLRQDSLHMLKKLGAYDEVIAKSGFVEKEVHIHSDGTTHSSQSKVPKGELQDHGRYLLHPTHLHTDSVSQVRISDVEKALLNQAQQLGIEIKSGVAAELTKSANGTSYDVSYRQVQKDGAGGFAPTGEATSLGTPDLVVAADGAGSPTRQSLGIEVLEQSAAKNYLGGHVQKGIGAETRKATVKEPGLKRHIMGTGHAKYDQTWVSVEITPDEAKLPPAERAKLLADKAQYVIGSEVKPEDIGWGAGQLTTVQNRRAKTTTAGDNVVLLGDAAGTGSVWVGGGLNLALTTHLSALKNLASRIQGNMDRKDSLHIYDKSLQWATTEWHRAGARELGVTPQAAQKTA